MEVLVKEVNVIIVLTKVTKAPSIMFTFIEKDAALAKSDDQQH